MSLTHGLPLPGLAHAGASAAEVDLLPLIEHGLWRFLPRCESGNTARLNQALHDAVFPGGKRLRPILTILGSQIFASSSGSAAESESVVAAASAVEFLHTSSLILDDLPCMDDADLRRGAPALHRAYGEHIALLAALALLNQSYALLCQNPELTRQATDCIGVAGMIGGQAIDLGAEPGDHVLMERNRKTSALMRLAITAGALSLGVSRQEIGPLAAAGQRFGLAYQICDDMLDLLAVSPSGGKTPGQDARHQRPSHMAASDFKACRAQVGRLTEEARLSLVEAYGYGAGVARLTSFIDHLFASQTVSLSRMQKSALWDMEQ